MRIVAAAPDAATLDTPSKAPPPPPPKKPPPCPPPCLTKVSEASISVFSGKFITIGRYTALRLASRRYVPGRMRPANPAMSCMRKGVKSISTRPPVSAAASNPHSVEGAKASSTALRSAGLSLDARKR